MPKSARRGRPSGSHRMLDGVTSRCTTPCVVDVGEGVGDRRAQRRRPPPAGRAPSASRSARRRALDELEHDVRVAVVLAGVEHPHEAGVVERRQDADLAVEARPVGRRPGPEHLHGDAPLEPLVLGLVHVGHAAAGDVAASSR